MGKWGQWQRKLEMRLKKIGKDEDLDFCCTCSKNEWNTDFPDAARASNQPCPFKLVIVRLWCRSELRMCREDFESSVILSHGPLQQCIFLGRSIRA